MNVTVGPDVDLDTEVITLPTGRRYTAEEARDDVAMFEAHHSGRPSLDVGVSPQVGFRVPAALKRKLVSVAQRTGRTEASIARDALSQYLAAA